MPRLGYKLMSEEHGPKDLIKKNAVRAERAGFDFAAISDHFFCGPSLERHMAAIGKYLDAGFDHIVLTQIGPEQDYFLEVFEKELAPALRGREKAA